MTSPDQDISRTPRVKGPVQQEQDRSAREQIEELVATTRTAIAAELSYQKARVDANVAAGRRLIILFVIGLGFAVAAVTALLLGLVVSLAPLITGLGATAVVCLAGGMLAWMFIRLAIRQARKMPIGENSGTKERANGGR
ncbi:MAG: phage holin family protein [Parasphingorhabdus sp.]|nr:phage holin family protein [Parasphingorhabdus sp.]